MEPENNETFEKIVVTLDGSRLAEVALPYAEEIAAKMGHDLVLLTIRETEEIDEYKKRLSYLQKMEETTKYHVNKYIENGRDKSIDVIGITRSGDPAENITKYASSGGFPLIIMASHGRSGISRWTVGSVADKVVRFNSQQPVMLIRAKQSHSDIREKRIIKKALIPLDGSERSKVVIPYIAQMATKLEMELTLIHVLPNTNNTNNTEIETCLQSECNKLIVSNINASYRINFGKAAESIIDFADEFAFDLVAMSTRGMNRGDIFSLGSVAQKVFLGGNTPLFLVKK